MTATRFEHMRELAVFCGWGSERIRVVQDPSLGTDAPYYVYSSNTEWFRRFATVEHALLAGKNMADYRSEPVCKKGFIPNTRDPGFLPDACLLANGEPKGPDFVDVILLLLCCIGLFALLVGFSGLT